MPHDSTYRDFTHRHCGIYRVRYPWCIPRAAPYVHDADAITHTVFLGIVLAFFVTEDLNSPLLLVGATVVGVGTVWLTEMLHNTGLVNEDASIGIIFPLLFSIAIILVSLYSGNAHLDVDTALLGEIAFAPFDSGL